jgi:hypothetical protein
VPRADDGDVYVHPARMRKGTMKLGSSIFDEVRRRSSPGEQLLRAHLPVQSAVSSPTASSRERSCLRSGHQRVYGVARLDARTRIADEANRAP